MRIAIHQPNFVPHLPYFDKMKEVDLFIFMIHCQWEKGKYQNRFHVGETWHTMSVNHGLEPIVDKKYLWPEKDWNRIRTHNKKLGVFDDCISDSLWKTNVKIIKKAAFIMGIGTPYSFDYETDLRGTERLVDLCVTHGATEYLSGPSGKNYLDVNQFTEAGIKVVLQESIPTQPLINIL